MPRFTWEIFRIQQKANIRARDREVGVPPAYVLADLQGEIIEHAIFYENEISLVDPSILEGKFPIREILEEEPNRVKVWWHGGSKKDAQWIKRSQLEKSI